MSGRADFILRANADYIEDQHRRWLENPRSVPEDWALFFAGVDFGERRPPAAGGPDSAFALVHAYREFGHLLARLDPLGGDAPATHPFLELAAFGLDEADLDREVQAPFHGDFRGTLRQLIEALRETYCGTLGAEFMDIPDATEREWLQQRMESTRNRPQLSSAARVAILRALLQADGFEQFLHARYTGQKRFSLEGGASLIPMFQTLVDSAAGLGVEQLTIGMSHRGRINFLANIMRKPLELIFSEFESAFAPPELQGHDDVKYHLGYSSDHVRPDGRRVHLSLTYNPSHLEFVNPVVLGAMRARQEMMADRERVRGIPVLIHGDASVSGEGIVPETLALAQLPAYQSGGTLHIVINNQIGFTTSPHDARATRYASAIMRVVDAPVLHVNGDDPEACVPYREAVVCYEHALVALEHVPDSRAASEQAIDLRLGLRITLNVLGAVPERTLDHLRRAETLAQTLGDQLRLGWVYAHMNNNLWAVGDVDRAIDYGQRALALAATLGDVGLQAWAHFSLGRIYYDAGDYARAVESFERNVAALHGELLYERFGTNGSVAASSRAWLSYCLAERGAFTEGLAMAEDGLRIAETVNHPFRLIEACSGVSMVCLRQGDVPRAILMLERAMSLSQDWHILSLLPVMAAALGLAYALEGRIAAGLALAEHGVEQIGARGRARSLTPAITCLSEAYLLAGRLAEARQCAGQALDLARQYQQRGHQAWALWLLGEVAARHTSPEVESAAGHYRQALALAEGLGMRPLQAHCHRSLGTLYARQGQQQQARAALGTAIALYRDMEMTFWLPQVEAVLAQMG